MSELLQGVIVSALAGTGKGQGWRNLLAWFLR